MCVFLSPSSELLPPIDTLLPEHENEYSGRSLSPGDEIEQKPLPIRTEDGDAAKAALEVWRESRTPGVFRAVSVETESRQDPQDSGTSSPAENEKEKTKEEDVWMTHFGWSTGRWTRDLDYFTRRAGKTNLRIQAKAPQTANSLFDFRTTARHETVTDFLKSIAAGGEERERVRETERERVMQSRQVNMITPTWEWIHFSVSVKRVFAVIFQSSS